MGQLKIIRVAQLKTDKSHRKSRNVCKSVTNLENWYMEFEEMYNRYIGLKNIEFGNLTY